MSKKLVMFSSIVLLASLISFAAYAYNAYCSWSLLVPTNELTMNASMNNHGLINGMYTVYAKVTQPITRSSNYHTQQFSKSVASKGSASNGGTSYAYVHGYDAIGQYCQASDSATYP